MTILPIPQQMQTLSGSMPLEMLQHLSLIAPKDSQQKLLKHMKEVLAEAGIKCNIQVSTYDTFSICAASMKSGRSAGAATNATQPLLDLYSKQGYQLEIRPEGLAIGAGAEQGLFYGLMTLRQMILEAQQERQNSIPAVSIIDWPAIEMRGYQEDYGRDQLPTMDDHKRSIRRLAQYKANSYLFYAEADHFVYKFDPNISPDYDRFTIAQVKELSQYARQYYIELIPVVELLGHCEMLLRHERYKRIAEMPGGGGDLCPTSEETWQVVANIIDELAPAFGTTYFHAGLDESMAIGQGRSKSAVMRNGIAKVYADYYNRLNRQIKKHGQIMMMYGDIVMNHPDILNMLDKDVVLMAWDYGIRDRYPSLDRFDQLGFRTTALSGLWDWSQAYPLSGGAFQNIDIFTKQAIEVGSVGAFVSDWGDGYRGANGMNLSENTDSGSVYCSCVGWRGQSIPIAEYFPLFCKTYYGTSDPQLAEALLSLALAQGKGLDNSTRALNMQRGDILSSIFAMMDTTSNGMDFWKPLEATASSAIETIKRTRIPRNGDRMDAVIVAARHLVMASKMASAASTIAAELVLPKPNNALVENTLQGILREQKSLRDEYKKVYLRRNRPINMMLHIKGVWEYTIGCIETALRDNRAGKLGIGSRKELAAEWKFDPAAPWESSPKGLTLAPKDGNVTVGKLPSGAGYAHFAAPSLLSCSDTKKLLDFGTNAFTCELWLRHTGQPELPYGNCFVSDGAGWRFGMNSTNKLMFTLYGVRDMVCDSAVLPADGKWHHTAVSFSYCHSVRFYIDGALVGHMDLAGRPNSVASPFIAIGNEGGMSTSFVGDMARIRVHAGALEPNELDSKQQPE